MKVKTYPGIKKNRDVPVGHVSFQGGRLSDIGPCLNTAKSRIVKVNKVPFIKMSRLFPHWYHTQNTYNIILNKKHICLPMVGKKMFFTQFAPKKWRGSKAQILGWNMSLFSLLTLSGSSLWKLSFRPVSESGNFAWNQKHLSKTKKKTAGYFPWVIQVPGKGIFMSWLMK